MKKIVVSLIALMVFSTSFAMAATVDSESTLNEEVTSIDSNGDFTKGSDDFEDYEDGRMYKVDDDGDKIYKTYGMMDDKFGQGRFAAMIAIKLIVTLIFLPLVVYLVSRAWHTGAIDANRANNRKK